MRETIYRILVFVIGWHFSPQYAVSAPPVAHCTAPQPSVIEGFAVYHHCENFMLHHRPVACMKHGRSPGIGTSQVALSRSRSRPTSWGTDGRGRRQAPASSYFSSPVPCQFSFDQGEHAGCLVKATEQTTFEPVYFGPLLKISKARKLRACLKGPVVVICMPFIRFSHIPHHSPRRAY